MHKKLSTAKPCKYCGANRWKTISKELKFYQCRSCKVIKEELAK